MVLAFFLAQLHPWVRGRSVPLRWQCSVQEEGSLEKRLMALGVLLLTCSDPGLVHGCSPAVLLLSHPAMSLRKPDDEGCLCAWLLLASESTTGSRG